MMKIPKSPGHDKNRERVRGEAYPCVICGRPVKSPKFLVECVGGGTEWCELPGGANQSDPGYMGCFPVGPDCLKRHPEMQPFVITPVE